MKILTFPIAKLTSIGLCATVLSALIISSPPAFAQTASGDCGFVVTPEIIDWELQVGSALLSPPSSAAADDSTLYYVPITFHVVQRSDGSQGMTRERQILALSDLNARYEQVGIKFFRYRDGDDYYTHYINSDFYYFQTNNDAAYTQLRQQSPVANTANVFFCPNTGLCGLANFPPSQLGAIVDDACVAVPGNASTFAHEIGHYFALYHTHETAFGEECPDGTNCAVAGDRLCDTPADPNLQSNATCNYTGSHTPPIGCGGSYDPQVDNLMSYAGKSCRDFFSDQQVAKMRNALVTQRPYLFNFDSTDWDSDGVFDVADNCPELHNPSQVDADLDGFGDDCLHAQMDVAEQLGAVPHTTTFTAASDLTVDSWEWDFGDSNTSPDQVAMHTYTQPGIYTIHLTVNTVDSSYLARRVAPVVVVADTMLADSVERQTDSDIVRVDVSLTNTLDVYQFILPFGWNGGGMDLSFDSLSTVGLRTNYFQVKNLTSIDPFNNRGAVNFIASATGALPPLAPGSDPVVSLYFTANGSANGLPSEISLDDWGSNQMIVLTEYGIFRPSQVNGEVGPVPYVCGDADGSNAVNIADVTYLISRIFTGGPAPVPPEAGDADGSGAVNIADVTYLIARIFNGGPEPVCP